MKLEYSSERIEGRSLTDLKRLTKSGEGQYLEFKYKAKYPDKLVREMVAFANSGGGLLLVGIDDYGDIIGVKFADEEEYVLVREIEKSVSPALKYSIERIHVGNEREVLIFHIPESEHKPHKAAEKVYVRHLDHTIQASKEVREILKGLKKDKNLRFNYGEKERILMSYLEEHKYITLNKFSEQANIPKKQASRTLVLMVLTNVLKYEAREEEDYYMNT